MSKEKVPDITIPAEVRKDWVKLRPQQRGFILQYLHNGGNGTQAYKDVGYRPKDDHVAGICASKLLGSARVWPVFYAILKANHLTPEYADVRLFEGLNATETKFFVHEGQVIAEREVIDWPSRLAALDMFHRLRGSFKQPPVPPLTQPVVVLPTVSVQVHQHMEIKSDAVETPSRTPDGVSRV